MVLGPLMLLACVVVPRISAPAPALRRATPGRSARRACHSSRRDEDALALPLGRGRARRRRPRRRRRRRPCRRPPAPVPPVPAPAAGTAALRVSRRRWRTKKARYFAPGPDRGACSGRVKPFVAGQVVTLRVVAQGQAEQARSAARSGAGGRFTFRFQVGSPGTLQARRHAHAATPQQVAFRATRPHDPGGVLAGGRGLARTRTCCCSSARSLARTSPPR